MEMPQPNLDILAKKSVVVAALLKVMARDAVIDDPSETRVYECDALTAYRCPRVTFIRTRFHFIVDHSVHRQNTLQPFDHTGFAR